MSYLTQEQIELYHENGFLCIRNYLVQSEVSEMRSQIERIVADFDMEEVSIFSTVEQTKTSDTYFIDSGDKVRCFFEEDAFDSNGTLKGKKEMSINKVGHALHDLDPEFQKISYKQEMMDMTTELGMQSPMIVQSQYIFKQPHIGGKVVAHQDSTFIYTDPLSCVGFWMALEDATIENGCLMAIPGSHRKGIGTRRFVRSRDGQSTTFIGKENQWDLSSMVPIEAKSGTLVLLHGSCVHMSLENRSNHTRHAYILHAVDGRAIWPASNWLQRPSDHPFRHLNQVINA
ncbi:MAG: phytanoyl-CoA dioxygenase family protein [Cyclobacteriaceae bacterium]